MTIVDDHALLVIAVVVAALSLLTNIVTLAAILNLRPFVERLTGAMNGVERASDNWERASDNWERVGQELLKAIAILVDRTSRPND